MNDQMVQTLMATIELVNSNLDTSPGSWRSQLQAIRDTTASFELTDTTPDEARRHWQMPFIDLVQRVAFFDADNGAIQDLADWSLRQSLTLLRAYPDNLEVLNLVGRNWLLRAQRALASIARADSGSSSSDASDFGQTESARETFIEAQKRLDGADYVEARGMLLPATEHLQRTVNTARAQGYSTGSLLSSAAEAFMSLGNVTSTRTHDCYYRQAMAHLRAAAALGDYSLPLHLQQYLDNYGLLYED